MTRGGKPEWLTGRLGLHCDPNNRRMTGIMSDEQNRQRTGQIRKLSRNMLKKKTERSEIFTLDFTVENPELKKKKKVQNNIVYYQHTHKRRDPYLEISSKSTLAIFRYHPSSPLPITLLQDPQLLNLRPDEQKHSTVPENINNWLPILISCFPDLFLKMNLIAHTLWPMLYYLLFRLYLELRFLLM